MQFISRMKPVQVRTLLDIIPISDFQLHALRRLMQGTPEHPKAPLGNNFRPPQPLLHRPVRTNIDFRAKQNGKLCPSMYRDLHYKGTFGLAKAKFCEFEKRAINGHWTVHTRYHHLYFHLFILMRSQQLERALNDHRKWRNDESGSKAFHNTREPERKAHLVEVAHSWNISDFFHSHSDIRKPTFFCLNRDISPTIRNWFASRFTSETKMSQSRMKARNQVSLLLISGENSFCLITEQWTVWTLQNQKEMLSFS